MNESTVPSEPTRLIGTGRRFGEVGPVYEVVGVADAHAAGGPVMRIRVVETNEEVDYRLTDLLDDPCAS